ncbi:MAG: caspase family protein [Bacteroidota bacterium]|nr:caspase family protein [Bacteroidota bacterium]
MKVKTISFNIIFLLLLSKLFSQTEPKHYLVINPNGHKGQVRELLVTKDQKQVVTGGFDKTIRVWDIETGLQSREILGQIGTGSNGMIYCMDLSPDNKLLASGGWFGKNDETSSDMSDIRIFEFETGKLLYVLKGHTNVIQSVQFTPDGKYLLAASAEDELWLWNLTTKKVERKYNHADKKLGLDWDDEVRDITISGKQFVTADQYGRIKLWSLDKKDTIRCDHYYEQIQADGVAYSPDGNWIVACIDTFFTIYDKNLKPVQEATGQFAFINPAFSPDGTKIVFAATGSGSRTCDILSLENGEWKPYAEFSDIDNSVLVAKFIDNETIAFSGGSKDEIAIVKLGKKNEKPVVLKRMVGLGKILYNASLNDKKLAYADEWTENFGQSKLNKQFDLFYKEFEKLNPKLNWNKPVWENGEYSLKRYKIKDADNGGLFIKKNGKIYDSIPLEHWNGSEHHSFCFANNNVITGNCCGLLRSYNYRGVQTSYFVGHVGIITALTISSDGKRLISSSDDRTIKIWSLDEIGKGRENDSIGSIADYCKKQKIYDGNGWEMIFKILKVEKESKQAGKSAWLSVIDAIAKNGYPSNAFKSYFSDHFTNEILPIASVFFTEDGDWLIWNEKGYFASSKKGSRFVGYHINQGQNKEAKYYPFEQFDLKYNRPDIILQDLGIASIEVIKAYHLAYEKRLKRMGVKEDQLSDDIHLPEVVIKNKTHDEQKHIVTISVSANDDKYNLDRINIYVNDVPIYGTNGINLKGKPSNTYTGDILCDLSPGKNKIQISVLNEKGAESLKETFSVINKETTKPDLYIVSIGVSKYSDKNFNLNFAAKDADDVAHFFEKSNLYNKVLVKELTDEQVTKEAIIKLKDDFLKNAQTKDLVMVFAAGHGVLDKNMNYYFATYNMDFNNPSNGGIAYEELEELLNGIKPVKKLFFMDSCHSGELDKDEYAVADPGDTKAEPVGEVKFRTAGNVSVSSKSGMGLSQSSQLATDLFADLRRGTGATIISSAGGAEFAMESKAWNNGLFTYCFLSGMKEKSADKNKDGNIMLSEIEEYVHDKVAELSGGKQIPTARRENLEFDFRIW